MNILINSQQPYFMQEVEESEIDVDVLTAGEIFSMALIVFLVTLFFVVSSWSALLLLSGNTANGGPIGLIFKLIRTTGIV